MKITVYGLRKKENPKPISSFYLKAARFQGFARFASGAFPHWRVEHHSSAVARERGAAKLVFLEHGEMRWLPWGFPDAVGEQEWSPTWHIAALGALIQGRYEERRGDRKFQVAFRGQSDWLLAWKGFRPAGFFEI